MNELKPYLDFFFTVTTVAFDLKRSLAAFFFFPKTSRSENSLLDHSWKSMMATAKMDDAVTGFVSKAGCF